MMITPILKAPIKPFDATKEYSFVFYADGGGQVLRNNLVIEDMATGTVVYNQTKEDFSLRHIVPPNTLTNGKNYVAKIRTGGTDNKWSSFSQIEIFYCFSKANLNFTTIDYANQNGVYNQTVTMKATYEQLEGETLQSYKFLLYDSNKNLIKSFPEQFYSGVGELEQEITGLDNGVLYHIQVKTESVNGLLSDSELVWFKPFYVTPRLSAVLTPENIKEQGAIKLSANIVQIVGKLYDKQGKEVPFEDIAYRDGETLELSKHNYKNLVFKQNFNIEQSDFLIKLWCENIPTNRDVFLRLSGNDGFIDLLAYNNRVHTYKVKPRRVNKAHFISNEINLTPEGRYMVAIKQEDNLIDITVKPY